MNDHPLVTQNPERYRELSNGAIYDNESHRIVAVDNSKNAHAITIENASQYQQARRDKAIKAHLDGVARAGGGDWTLGIEAIAYNQARKAMSPGDQRSTEAARLVYSVIGLTGDGGASVATATAAATGAVAALLELAARRRAEVE